MKFIKAQPDDRLRMIRRKGDCTTCLERGHDADAHMEMNQNETTTCGLYIKASGTACNSIQNAFFHGSASHNARSRSTNSQRRVIPQLTFIIALGILLKGIQVSEGH